jgi:two-component system response regulator NreC
MERIKVILIDDVVILREGIRLLLEKAPDIEVLGEAGDKTEAMALMEQMVPDVVLMDINLPGLMETTRWLKDRYPSNKVLITTMEETDPYLLDLLEAGVSGCIVKTSTRDELISAIREVYSGNTHLSPSAARTLVENYLRRADRREEKTIHDGLTPREWEILTYIAADMQNKEIASLLGISVRTVQAHRTNLMEKLGAHDRIQLVKYAIRKGIVRP